MNDDEFHCNCMYASLTQLRCASAFCSALAHQLSCEVTSTKWLERPTAPGRDEQSVDFFLLQTSSNRQLRMERQLR